MSQSSFAHRKPKSWQKTIITVPKQHSDIVASFLAELTNTAIEQSTITPPFHSALLENVIVYLEENEHLKTLNKQILAFLCTLEKQQNFSYTLESEQIIEEDWNKNWKKVKNLFKTILMI